MATMTRRPQSAPVRPKYMFSTTGVMARPAGVPGIFASTGGSASPAFEYGKALPKATGLLEHALKRHSPYAQTASFGWKAPGLEAMVKPTASVTGAGVVSAGSIDNTYVPAPLQNRWGKARERAIKEVYVPPKQQATDLLVVAKGAVMPPPSQSMADMKSVRPTYSKTIPLFHPIDPQRQESGFVRPPNIIPGAKPPPGSPLLGITSVPCVGPDHLLQKLAYDQSQNNIGRIPVARVVKATLRPKSAAPAFMTRAAGLPGGLSLSD